MLIFLRLFIKIFQNASACMCILCYVLRSDSRTHTNRHTRIFEYFDDKSKILISQCDLKTRDCIRIFLVTPADSTPEPIESFAPFLVWLQRDVSAYVSRRLVGDATRCGGRRRECARAESAGQSPRVRAPATYEYERLATTTRHLFDMWFYIRLI